METAARVAARPGGAGLFLALAPMDGVTCHVHRALVTDSGPQACGISLCVSEFVRVTDRMVADHVFLRAVPEIAEGGATPGGVPVFVQILGGNPKAMAASARAAVRLGAPGVDINFGCPAKTVNRHDGGAAILREPDRVYGITAAARDAVASPVPVTVKIRLGWAEVDEVFAVADAVARAGASWLTIHCRTKAQGYRPPVHWSAVRHVVAASPIPVVVNGDLFAPTDVAACRDACGARHFMIGRGIMARPDLCAQIRGRAPDAPAAPPKLARWIARYEEALERDGLPPVRRLRRIKQWFRMASAIDGALAPYFDRIKRLEDLEDALLVLRLMAAEPETPARSDPRPGRTPHSPRVAATPHRPRPSP